MTVISLTTVKRVLLVGILFLAACQGEDVVFINEGIVCLKNSDGGDSIESGQSLLVTVRLDECLSSSCQTNGKAGCTATINGGSIEVESRFSYVNETWHHACTADCQMLVAECETEPIAEGDYTAFLGDNSVGDLWIPYEDLSYYDEFQLCFE